MKVLGLLAFLTVFLLSSAYADSRGRGHHNSLLESEDRRHGETLQRKKPPVKLPGPALTAEYQQQESNLRQLLEEEESKNVYLSSNENRRHSPLDSHDNDKDKEKHKHFVNGDNVEESQQERSRSFRSD